MERVLRFGSAAPLVGVMTEPEVVEASRPAVIILNSGIMHHVGTCRLSVRIARALAEAGFVAFRFDSSGIGDSGPRKDALPFEESAPRETREAMDLMTKKTGAERFVLMGLCSGADMSYETALKETLVVGIVQIDPYAYRTPKAHLVHFRKHYLPRLTDTAVLKRFAKRQIKKRLGLQQDSATPRDERVEMPAYVRVFPPQHRITDGLRRLTSRGVRIYCMFTGDEEAYLYEDQLFDMHPGLDRSLVEVRYLEQADHIVTDLAIQRDVAKSIASWAATQPW